MAHPNFITKTLQMKPEVTKIFDDLDAWLDHCKMEMINYDPKDLYRSPEYKFWQRGKSYGDKKHRREFKPRRDAE